MGVGETWKEGGGRERMLKVGKGDGGKGGVVVLEELWAIRG